MNERPDRNTGRPDAAVDEQGRIRRQRIAEFKAFCDRVGAEAKARGLTEEILNDILKD